MRDKYILQLETNTFHNLKQIHLTIWNKYILQLETNTILHSAGYPTVGPGPPGKEWLQRRSGKGEKQMFNIMLI